MSRIKRNPYGKTNVEIVPAVRAENRLIYFAKMGAITPDISPIDQQEREKKKARITALLFEAGDELARQKGIPSEDARQMFFPRKTKDGQEITPLNFFDYLSKDDKAELLLLQSETQDIEIMAATLFMRFRLAYDITLTESCKAKAKTLYIKEPWFEVQAGDTYKFPELGIVIEVTEPYDPETESIGVLPVPAMEAGATGFLYNKVRHAYTLGDDAWTVEDTRAFMTTSAGVGDEDQQIQQLYRLYQEEAGLRKPSSKSESPEGNETQDSQTTSETPLAPTSVLPSSTGDGFGEGFSTSDVETNGSATKDLALSRTG